MLIRKRGVFTKKPGCYRASEYSTAFMYMQITHCS
jgi:hypothetical protein